MKNQSDGTDDIEFLINKADDLIENAVKNINYELINLYWNIGKMIAEYKRKNNSKYGDNVVKKFSESLYVKYGRGFDRKNIFKMIKFYELFSKESSAINCDEQKVAPGRLSDEHSCNDIHSGEQKVAPARLFKNISWSHIVEILKVSDRKQIYFYLNEITVKRLTKLELRNYIKSKSYERTVSIQKSERANHKLELTLKNPMILDIENKRRSEKELENEIMRNLSNFKNEIGNNIMFYEQQYKINCNGLIYRVDLVLYDKGSKSYILIDLKVNKIKQRDISQMKFYIDYFNESVRDKGDNKTVGIILCETTDIRVFVDKDIYQIKYLNEIPKEKELLKIINENKIILLKTEKLQIENK